MNSITQIEGSLYLQAVENVGFNRRVCFPIAFSGAVLFSSATDGKRVVRDSFGFTTEDKGFSVIALGHLVEMSDEDRYWYDPVRRGFLNSRYSNIPDTAIEISEEEWREFVAKVNDHSIEVVDGKVVAVYAPPPEEPAINKRSVASLSSEIRRHRNKILTNLDWAVMRHLREERLGIETSLSETMFTELLKYQQEVCAFMETLDMNAQIASVDDVEWPVMNVPLQLRLCPPEYQKVELPDADSLHV